MASGAVADIIVIVAGSIVFSTPIDYVTLIFGNMISVALALILEFFIFSVDYSKAEKFQYEDDELLLLCKGDSESIRGSSGKAREKDQQAEDGSEKA